MKTLLDNIVMNDAYCEVTDCRDVESCEKCVELILSEHDKQIRTDERAKVIGMCAKVIATQLPNICTTSCPVKCEWGTDETCADYWKKYLLEQLKGAEE